ncbi:MAG TPA: OmpA family protein [Phnomibacter sp.]|nr:OmpA family protein [Phnomibacter sp.]
MMLQKKKSTNDAELGALDTKGNFIYHIGDTIGLKLPDGTVLRVGDRSTEARLIRFLTDVDSHVDTVNKSRGWITCDRIYFETGVNHLTTESKTQIANITEILHAFPNAHLKVGGYSDNSGDSLVNQKLSDARAAAVLAAIRAGGAKNAVESEGYGAAWPIASNETEEGRAMNRRVDVRVIKK